MQHHPSSSTSACPSLDDYPEFTEFQDFGARLDAILAGPSALDGILADPCSLPQYALDAIEDTVYGIRGGNDFDMDGVTHTEPGNIHRPCEVSVMDMDATVLGDLSHAEPEDPQPEKSVQQVVSREQVEDVVNHPEEHLEENLDVRLDTMLDEFLENQTTQAKQLPSWNPYADSDVKDVVLPFKPTTLDKKRKKDESAKKHQFEGARASLPTPFSSPNPSVMHTPANVHPQGYGVVPLPAPSQAVPQYAANSQFTSKMAYQNAGLTGPQCDTLPSVQHPAPVVSQYVLPTPSQYVYSSPYTDQSTSSYTIPPASPYLRHAPASPSDYAQPHPILDTLRLSPLIQKPRSASH
jgi:hypothetical protein